jgi:hypothetical protein
VTNSWWWIPNKTIEEDSSLNYRLFWLWSDLDYTVTLSDGTALPAWIKFDSSTRTFSGDPPANWNGSCDIKIVGKGRSGTEWEQTFTLTVEAVNDKPIQQKEIADQTATDGTPWTFQLPSDTFTDVDDSALTYTASLVNGKALPAWLKFDPKTLTFTGTLPQNKSDLLNITVTASDSRASASDTFKLIIQTVDDAPVVNVPIADQRLAEDTVWAFQVPENTFTIRKARASSIRHPWLMVPSCPLGSPSMPPSAASPVRCLKISMARSN